MASTLQTNGADCRLIAAAYTLELAHCNISGVQDAFDIPAMLDVLGSRPSDALSHMRQAHKAQGDSG